MNDAFAERFDALADRTDDFDWLDVRRRARGRTRFVLPTAAAVAAIAAASAFAATSGWVFSSNSRQVTAQRDVAVAGRTWDVSYSASTRLHAVFCLRATSPGAATRSRCVEMGPGEPRIGPPLDGLKLSVPGGAIWAGALVGFTRRVAITDAAGHVHTALAVRPPRGTKTPFRWWLITLGASPARSITSYGSNGRHITTRLH
jgi:hypothetical protein